MLSIDQSAVMSKLPLIRQPQVVGSPKLATHNQNAQSKRIHVKPLADLQSSKRLLIFQDSNETCSKARSEWSDQVSLEVVSLPSGYVDLSARIESMQPDCVLFKLSDISVQWLEWLAKLTSERPLPMVLWVDTHSEANMMAAQTAGICAYWVGAGAYHNLLPNLEFAHAQFKRIQTLEKQLRVTQSRLDDRKWVEKAKGLMMQQNGISESAAYTQLRSSAMSQGLTLGEISKRVISVFEEYA